MRRGKRVEFLAFAVACASPAWDPLATAQAARKIEPKADRHLKEACTYLAGLKDFALSG